MSPQRVGFLSRFGLKTGIGPFFAGIGGYGFRGNFGSVWTYLSFQFQMYANSKCILEIFFFQCWRSNLNNDDIICYTPGLKSGTDFRGQVWKRMWKMAFFDLTCGQNLENQAGRPHQKLPGVPPRKLLIDQSQWQCGFPFWKRQPLKRTLFSYRSKQQ